jgi:hypothetical protein
VSNIKVYTTSQPRLLSMTLEQLINELNRYAFLTIFNHHADDTWSASAAMRIKTKGAQFEVKSGYNHPSVHSALSTLLDLVENAVKELGQAKY